MAIDPKSLAAQFERGFSEAVAGIEGGEMIRFKTVEEISAEVGEAAARAKQDATRDRRRMQVEFVLSLTARERHLIEMTRQYDMLEEVITSFEEGLAETAAAFPVVES